MSSFSEGLASIGKGFADHGYFEAKANETEGEAARSRVRHTTKHYLQLQQRCMEEYKDYVEACGRHLASQHSLLQALLTT